jgi:hypothetical protein
MTLKRLGIKAIAAAEIARNRSAKCCEILERFSLRAFSGAMNTALRK